MGTSFGNGLLRFCLLLAGKVKAVFEFGIAQLQAVAVGQNLVDGNLVGGFIAEAQAGSEAVARFKFNAQPFASGAMAGYQAGTGAGEGVYLYSASGVSCGSSASNVGPV